MVKYDLVRMLYAKYNELDSLKKYVKDDVSISIIEAKQDTVNDVIKLVETEVSE